MATTKLLPRVLLLSLMTFAIGAQARPGVHFHPCHMFIVSVSYSVSSPTKEFTTIQSIDSLPQLDFALPSDFSLRRLDIGHGELPYSELPRIAVTEDVHPTLPREEIVVPATPAIAESARDRARDILSVVICLILGAGCGTLVASTMYLVWSLINNHSDIESRDEEEITRSDGYVKIPADSKPVKVKEVYEAN